MKSWKRNFLEPSGPLQACNATALPLPNAVQCTTIKMIKGKGPYISHEGTQSPIKLNLATRWWWSASHLSTLPRKSIPGTQCIGGWVGPRASPHVLVER